jgi:protoporphyrinogen oxidase
MHGNTRYLYDFTLLTENIKDINILQKIQSDCMKSTSVAFREYFITLQIDNFTCYTGQIYFKPYTVYSNSKNKRVYNIMQAVYLEFYKQDRDSIYDKFYTVTENIIKSIGHDNEITDCEIA